jgi:hypothetical protein
MEATNGEKQESGLLTGRNAFKSIEVELPLKGGELALTEPPVGIKSTVGDENGGVSKRKRRDSAGYRCDEALKFNMCNAAVDDKLAQLTRGESSRQSRSACERQSTGHEAATR